MRRRIDISEVETATKIRAKYLRALENEEWDLLPGPTFVKTFLRTYAEFLEIDDRVLVEEFKQRFERPTQQELTPFSPNMAGRRRPSRSGPSPAMVVAAVVIALVGLLFAIGKLWPTGDEEPTTSGNSVVGSGEPSATPTRSPSTSGSKRPSASSTRPVRFQIIPTGRVSVCLVDASGKRLIDDAELLADAPTRQFRSRRFRVSFGNGAARMRINGKSFDVPNRSTPVGFEIRAGAKRPRELGAGKRPNCA